MEREIVGYHSDEDGQWVAELSCGHHRHVRHEPPFQVRTWVLTAAGRAGMVGTPIFCGRCVQQTEGGDPACWAHLLCPQCGTVLDGGPHPAYCSVPLRAEES